MCLPKDHHKEDAQRSLAVGKKLKNARAADGTRTEIDMKSGSDESISMGSTSQKSQKSTSQKSFLPF